jgi:tetratricopeptide (TPR) repeat protein
MENNDVALGIAAAKAGKIQEAQGLLVRAVQANPASEEGWLWLGHCLNEPKKREFCYKRVLSLNPNNETARRALLALTPSEPVIQPEKPSQPAQTAVPPTLVIKKAPVASPKPLAAPQPKAKIKPKGLNQNLIVGLGVTITLLVCISVFGLLWFSGALTGFSAQIIPNLPTPAPAVSATLTPAPSLTPILILSSATPTPNVTKAARNIQIRADIARNEALSFMNQGQYEQAIASWDKVIALVQDNDIDYVQRSTCEYSLSLTPISLENILHYLELALADMDKAIALKPDRIEYYGRRRQVFGRLGDMQDLTVNRLFLYERSLADLQVVITRAPGQFAEADSELATLLVYSGHCDEGLSKLQELLAQAEPEQKAHYYFLQSVGYACLGKLDQALQSLDRASATGDTADALALRNEYLYQAGRSKEALAGINKFIEAVPDYGGERYYLRALIYYEMGNTAQAEQDLATGKRLAYTNGQVLAYVQGKLAIDQGNKEEGIKYLQLSEASLDVVYNVLRSRVQKELTGLGTQPLPMTPTVLLTRTPTP